MCNCKNNKDRQSVFTPIVTAPSPIMVPEPTPVPDNWFNNVDEITPIQNG